MAASSSRESIARNNSSLGAVFRVSTVMARSSVKRPDCVRRKALKWAPQPSAFPIS